MADEVEKPRRYLVLAGNHTEFLSWLRENQVDKKDAVFVARESDVVLRYPEDGWTLVQYGTAYKRGNYSRLVEYLRSYGFEV